MHAASKRWRVYAFALLAGLVLAVAGVAAGCGGTKTVTKTVTNTATKTVTVMGPQKTSSQAESYGHVKSLTRKGNRYEMRLDPAWVLSGVAAEHAAVEDGAMAQGESVPNGAYRVDEGHRLLTYVVLPTAHVTVLTRGLWHTVIPVSELAQILEGKNPQHRVLFYPANSSASSAFSIRVDSKYPGSPVVSLDQAYQP
jgi:hypothetical protein